MTRVLILPRECAFCFFHTDRLLYGFPFSGPIVTHRNISLWAYGHENKLSIQGPTSEKLLRLVAELFFPAK